MPGMKPLCIDLCCGSGGWAAGFLAEGYRVIGFDIEEQPDYPGEFMQADVKVLAQSVAEGGIWHQQIADIVASPPCEQFTRHEMPWTRKRNPPQPDLSIVEACRSIATITGKPMIMENVRKAQDWLGSARWHIGAFYLWGDVPALMPTVTYRKKESYGSDKRLERARVPFDLARHIAACFKPPSVYPAWISCPGECGEFWCTIHREHAYDCPCPEIEDWDGDPYASGGLPLKEASCRNSA